MNLESHPVRKEQVIAQKASNEFLLFNLHDGNYYSLNEVGSRIWELCDGDHSVAELVETLTAEYDVPTEPLTKDVLELLEELQSGKLIVEATRTKLLARSGIAR